MGANTYLLYNDKRILIVCLPSRIKSIYKDLKRKENYLIFYTDKNSIKNNKFDTIIVDTQMPEYFEFYKSIVKHIKVIHRYQYTNGQLKLLK